MRISKVSLVKGGLGGLKVSYQDTTIKKNLTFVNNYNTSFSAPVNGELKSDIGKLAEHVRLVCHILKNKEDNITVIGFSRKGEEFVIEAKVDTLDTTFSLKTPEITVESEYAGFGDIQELIENIIEGVNKYIVNFDAVDDKQIVMDFTASQPVEEGETPFDITNLSAEEISDMCTDILTNMGAIVIPAPEDLPMEMGIDTEVTAETEAVDPFIIEVAEPAKA